MENATLIIFTPEHWGQLDRFHRFYSQTYAFKPNTQKAVSGAVNHFQKAITLRNLAKKLAPNLEIDEKELNKNGYTPAINSRELSAVIEGIILELYSSIDCTRKVIKAIYGDFRGIPDSTRRLFQNAFNEIIDDRVPEFLRETIKNADWFPGFRKIRDELTHSDIGTCFLNPTTRKISYMHPGFRVDNKALIIENIFKEIEKNISDVNVFIGKIYSHLNSTLENKEVYQMCGIFNGRVYSRFVSPSQAVDFNSGRCDAFRWFEKAENPTCPFCDRCGAYKNRES